MVDRIVPLLLSGGSGTRLWPLSRADMPKQLQVLAYEETMIQATALRARGCRSGLDFGDPVIVAGEPHRFLILEQLEKVGVTPAALLLEPEGRNTAPAVALGAHWVMQYVAPDALLLVMPSDHLIANEAAFHAAIAAAAPAARDGALVTFGIKPTEPSVAYGYIAPRPGDGPAMPVERFVEKPDRPTAEAYMREGYFWNAGIFLFRADRFIEALGSHAPDVAASVRDAMASGAADGNCWRPEPEAFAASPSISIDYAVMERADNVMVVPVEMGWSDVGSWDVLWRVTAPDSDGNVRRGAGTMIACRDSLLRNEGGPFVAALGLLDMVIVSTPDAVLIAPRARAEEIRSVIEAVERAGLPIAKSSHEVHRPWGSYRALGSGEGWQVKRIAVKPGGRLSLQTHRRRAEIWVVAVGQARVTVGKTVSELGPGKTIEIPVGAEHRLENPGPEPLEIIEVQRGDYLGEDDIVRIADIYGRAG